MKHVSILIAVIALGAGGAAIFGSSSRAEGGSTSVATATAMQSASGFGVTYGPWEPDPKSCRRSSLPTTDGRARWEYTRECRQVRQCSKVAEVLRPRCWNDRPDCRGFTFRGGARQDTTGVCR
jgi:hypothetical protein